VADQADPVDYSVPGRHTDSATRMVVQNVAEQTGWTIVVDNKPGANSILGADLAA
jgi:tripartite-type tricarboxylate transporter receptor subunit TctC